MRKLMKSGHGSSSSYSNYQPFPWDSYLQSATIGMTDLAICHTQRERQQMLK
jgi:hypothetical protein